VQFTDTLRSYELYDDYSKFKSYSLDPFPDCQIKKRATDNYRKRKIVPVEEASKMIDCNGGICTTRQRSDNEPLLVNTNNHKRWHSLETVRADADHDAGCEDIVDNHKNSKSLGLGRSNIKTWLVGWFASNGLKNNSTPPRNGSGILLQPIASTVATKQPDMEVSQSIV